MTAALSRSRTPPGPRALMLFSVMVGIATLHAENSPEVGVLRFLDGSVLHGELQGAEAGEAVHWKHPLVDTPIPFDSSNIDSIRFRSPGELPARDHSGDRFRFTNGDDVFGRLVQLDAATVELECDYGSGGRLSAPRKALRAINFSSASSAVLYDGPTGVEGWTLGGPKGWRYRDGAFIANGVGTLGRNFGLTGSSRIQFDLSASGPFNMAVSFYTPVIERIDYSSSSYMLNVNRNLITLQRFQAGSGPVTLGQAPVMGLLNKERTRVEIRVNKERSIWSIFIDGLLFQEWQDTAGFGAKGTGICFAAQREGPTVELSNIQVSNWDWQADEELSEGTREHDWVFLANRDRVAGTIREIQAGQLILEAGQSELVIPLDRVTRIQLPHTPTQPSKPKPWLVRAEFFSGEQIQFELDQWNETVISGNNQNFGSMAFAPRAIRLLEFNPDRARTGPPGGFFMNLDEWEIE